METLATVFNLVLLLIVNLAFKGIGADSNLSCIKRERDALLKFKQGLTDELEKTVSHHLGNLSNLQYLDLSWNYGLEVVKLQWASTLPSLKHLDLSGLELTKAIECGEISQPFGSPAICLQNCLQSLVLETNHLRGRLPDSLRSYKHLVNLNLYSNTFSGPIPASIGRLSSLEILDLSHNYLNGSVPESVAQLFNLEFLNIHNNSLSDIVSERHFSKLPSLTTFWTPISTMAPNTEKCFNISISDRIPDWFESISSNIVLLDLYSDKFEDPLTPFPSDVIELDVSNKFLRGQIPQDIGNMMPRLTLLHLSNNSLNGNVPVSLCKMGGLRFLDLSENQFSGGIPNCWSKLQHLRVMDLSSNILDDHIPSSLGSLQQLRSFHLRNNSLQGKVPASLAKLKRLHMLDLSENVLNGTIPPWISEALSSLSVLDVHSNRFQGEIPQELCHLTSLRILSLAHNEMTGTIPSCFHNFTGMIANLFSKEEQWPYGPTIFDDIYGFQSVVYEENVWVYLKGLQQKYTKTLPFLFSIDLSRNRFVGEIPNQLMNLLGLQNLNLSRNNFKGQIPWKIGDLRQLQSLDLSRNELSGLIPTSLSQLNFLSVSNLTFNKLSGRIPSGNQLQTLDDKSIYAGNSGLCGFPLDHCQEVVLPPQEGSPEDEFEIVWFYGGTGVGFMTGFVGVSSTLYFKDSWRGAFFRLVDKIYNKFRVMIVVSKNHLPRKIYGDRFGGHA
ncbi:PREDICTED: leucine-rich repeat receptor-like protein kinase PEPR1 [Populus euphratica]|uniref:Leucine-rich repeat receptor-like protein kinase PEPR1 n=1 Tax=Populus euphratica TaxID=75702 RepID=A0AAJ6U3Y2_POPEU|nr:PREDICTED: leucine-rich repeat receptor-like protein kinase PEPR1 [Populus euphratica]